MQSIANRHWSQLPAGIGRALLLCFLCTGCASNQVSVWFENDALSYGPPTDANYTQGVQVTVQPTALYDPCDAGNRATGDCVANSRFKRVVNWLNFLETGDTQNLNEHPIWLEYAFGQQFYTPDDLRPSTVQDFDRPYAGWLFGSLRINNDRTRAGDGKADWLHDRRRTVTLKLGVVGPSSQSSAVQKWWHEDVCDCTYPNGWPLQVRDEPGVVVSGSQEDRLWYGRLGDRWRADLLSRSEISLGNVFTGGETGATARFGYNLPRSFSPLTISPQNLPPPSRSRAAVRPTGRFSLYGFVGVIGRVVLRDIFLDGNTFRSSPHTVDAETFVTEGQIGAAIGYGRWSLRVLYAHRSDQYETQRQSHRFGSFVITYTPDF